MNIQHNNVYSNIISASKPNKIPLTDSNYSQKSKSYKKHTFIFIGQRKKKPSRMQKAKIIALEKINQKLI